MRRPEWILFDYGETLVHEETLGIEAGYEAVLRMATENPGGATVAEVMAISGEFYAEIIHCAREHSVEVYRPNLNRLIFETLGVRFDVPYEALDDVFWDAAYPGVPSPGMTEFLAFLKEEGIPTGVVSNIGFSGASLCRRLDRLFPENGFRFVIATSEYGVRKPVPAIFRLAIQKTGAAPGDIWYIGDNAHADVLGAAAVGIVPVWYRSGLECSYRDARANAVPDTQHICVTDIMELAGRVTPGLCPGPQRRTDRIIIRSARSRSDLDCLWQANLQGTEPLWNPRNGERK